MCKSICCLERKAEEKCLGFAIAVIVILDNAVELEAEILELSWRIMGSVEAVVQFIISADKLWKETFWLNHHLYENCTLVLVTSTFLN